MNLVHVGAKVFCSRERVCNIEVPLGMFVKIELLQGRHLSSSHSAGTNFTARCKHQKTGHPSFICGLFKDAVSVWASNGKAKVNSEVEAVSR